jgi:hypothetical protein
MSLFWPIIIITHICSLVFLGLSLLRYFAYKKRNTIIENKYTLLFGFVRLEHMVWMYVIFVLAYTVGTFLFIYYLMGQ